MFTLRHLAHSIELVTAASKNGLAEYFQGMSIGGQWHANKAKQHITYFDLHATYLEYNPFFTTNRRSHPNICR